MSTFLGTRMEEMEICPLINFSNSFFFFKDFIYLTENERERAHAGGEVGRGRGRSRLPTELGAQCGALYQDSGIMT